MVIENLNELIKEVKMIDMIMSDPNISFVVGIFLGVIIVYVIEFMMNFYIWIGKDEGFFRNGK